MRIANPFIMITHVIGSLREAEHEQSSKTGGQALMKSHLHQRRSGFSSAVYLVLLDGVFRMT